MNPIVDTLFHCKAPAKLNLFLHVIGRRNDGYHLLQSAFQLIDRYDHLDIEAKKNKQIKRINEIKGVDEKDDLVIKAALLLQHHTQTQFGAEIKLNKTIPMGGGLGGGSSDAASTLIALNHLWQCQLKKNELMHLGLQLGADVPFFIFGHNAFVEGIGEQMSSIQGSQSWYLIIEPGVHVPTAAIFSSKQLTRNTNTVRITDFSNDTKNQWKNDLQDVACALFPEINEVILWLSKYGKAKMTGSGSCVFCEFDNELSAINTREKVPEKWKSWVAEALETHPMLSYLQN